MYIIVKFLKEDSVEMVPESWMISNKECYWPPANVKSYEIAALIRKGEAPMTTWQICDVSYVGSAATFNEARKKCKKAADMSDLEGGRLTSDTENYGRGKRRKKASDILMSSDDEEEEEPSGRYLQILNMIPKAPSKQSQVRLPSPPPTSSQATPVSSHSMWLHSPPVSSQQMSGSPHLMQPPSVSSQQVHASSHFMQSTTVGQSPSVAHEHKNIKEKGESVNSRILSQLHYLATEIHVLQNSVIQLHQKLDKCNCSTAATKVQSPEIGDLPLENLEKLNELENKLDDGASAYLMKKFRNFGGTNFTHHTRRLLKYTFKDNVAEQFNWLGSGEKRKFSSLKITKIIIDAVCDGNECTRSQVEDCIKNWLRHAKERKNYIKKSQINKENV